RGTPIPECVGMAGPATHPVLRFLRRLSPAADVGEASDADLLERFARRHDEEAFTALVRRHGPMVFGVCTRVLDNSADAEDAFQATFLVLVRRARSVSRPERLGDRVFGGARPPAPQAKAPAAPRRRPARRGPA